MSPAPHRRVLPQRRTLNTFTMQWNGKDHAVSVGYFNGDQGDPAEVFISSNKTGSELESVARDGAVLVSLALQHGVPLSVIAHAITRNTNGAPTTIVGAVIDLLIKEQDQCPST